MKLTLYHYWRSSTSWRVRWGFALKGIGFESIPIDLLKGEQNLPEHLERHPLGAVPVLKIETASSMPAYLTQSIAILQWAEDQYPAPALIFGNPLQRAKIQELAQTINADTHPLQNMHVQARFSSDPEQKKEWARHWIQEGLNAYEVLCSGTADPFSVGNQFSLADICLIPQVYNALRFDVDLKPFPTVQKIWKNAANLDHFIASHPDRYAPAGPT